MSEKVHYIIRQ